MTVMFSRSFFQLVGDLAELNEKSYTDLEAGDPSEQAGATEKAEVSEATEANTAAAEDIELGDLEVVATLGIGGFGRVELVKVTSMIDKIMPFYSANFFITLNSTLSCVLFNAQVAI